MRIRKQGRALVITVAGLHGSGRSTQANRLAEIFNLRYISTGIVFRERAKELEISLEEMNRRASEDDSFDRFLDARAKEESRKGGVVIDANLSAWMAEDPDLKFYLTTPFEERVRRIAGREMRSIEMVEAETRAREEMERERYKRYYGVDIDDLTVYDLILNTGPFDADTVAHILKNVVEAYMNEE